MTGHLGLFRRAGSRAPGQGGTACGGRASAPGWRECIRLARARSARPAAAMRRQSGHLGAPALRTRPISEIARARLLPSAAAPHCDAPHGRAMPAHIATRLMTDPARRPLSRIRTIPPHVQQRTPPHGGPTVGNHADAERNLSRAGWAARSRSRAAPPGDGIARGVDPLDRIGVDRPQRHGIADAVR